MAPLRQYERSLCHGGFGHDPFIRTVQEVVIFPRYSLFVWVKLSRDYVRQLCPRTRAKSKRFVRSELKGVYSMIVRPVAHTDYDEWEALWEGYNRFYNRTVPPEVTWMTWSRLFHFHEPVHALVAEKEETLVGLVHFVFYKSTGMLGPACYLQDLFTAEVARKAGIGRALIQAVYDRARAVGSTHVYWVTHETNLIARALYDKVAERSGFIVYGKTV